MHRLEGGPIDVALLVDPAEDSDSARGVLGYRSRASLSAALTHVQDCVPQRTESNRPSKERSTSPSPRRNSRSIDRYGGSVRDESLARLERAFVGCAHASRSTAPGLEEAACRFRELESPYSLPVTLLDKAGTLGDEEARDEARAIFDRLGAKEPVPA